MPVSHGSPTPPLLLDRDPLAGHARPASATLNLDLERLVEIRGAEVSEHRRKG
jgi:hypothetical protein